MSGDAIVTVTRTDVGRGLVDLSVAFARRGGQWFIKQVIDEDGREAVLTPTEEHLARCLVEAGVDETGR